MKVKCTVKYFDTKLQKYVNAGDELNVTDDRAKALISAKVAEAVAPTTPEVDTKPAPKKKAPVKKAKEA